jgi:hypothetical protein
MATPFDPWSARIAAAHEAAERKSLMTEISYWRATRLGDLRAQRDASFALARLHSLNGDSAAAIREAQSLVSLCQSPPPASAEELKMAVGLLQTLGGSGVVAKPARPPRAEGARPEGARREERRAESGRGERAPSRTSNELDDAIFAAASGRFELALRGLKGVHGPEAELVRTWISLARGLASEDPQRELSALERRLRQRLVPAGAASRAEPAEARPAARAREPRESGAAAAALATLLGQPIPEERQARIDVLEAAAASVDPDALAARALEHHREVEGLQAPAPWLIGLTARALASGAAPQTRAVVERLAAEGAWAVTAYSEPPFEQLVAVMRAAGDAGFHTGSLRRGVLSRGEPGSRKLWTLRLDHGGVEYMLVAGAASEEAYRPETAQRLARRVLELCPRILLVAPGAGNAGLRDALTGLGGVARESGDAKALLAELSSVEAVASAVSEPAEARAPRSANPREGEAIRELLAAETAPTVDALEAVLREMPRVHRCFPAARAALSAFDPAERDRRLAVLLDAAHRAAPEGVRLSEGASLAIEAYAEVGAGSLAFARATHGSSATRFGGAGFDTLGRLVGAAIHGGFQLDRVLRGTTIKERRDSAFLDAIGHAADGLWRALVQREGSTLELWFMAELSPEGRAAVPQLLLHPARRVVVVPVDGDLLSWYATLKGPDAVGWTGDEVADVVEALRRV